MRSIEIISVFYHKLISLKRKLYIKKLVKMGMFLGKNVDFVDTFFLDPSHCFLISIGDNCTICPNVRFIAHDASTKKYLGFTKIGRIVINEDCFIGDSTILLPSVSVGPNTILGAGSVVKKDIPPNCVAYGSPAKPVRSIESYLQEMNELAKEKGVFGDEYHIGRLNKRKLREMMLSVRDSCALIR